MHEILSESSISNKEMIMGLAPYGDHPTFSLSVNHYQTYTGITDKDRALTISEMAKIYNVENKQKKFASSFKTPGHVPLLIASKNLLAARQGHTEMSVYLAQVAGLTPVTAICEMMDAETYTALSVDKAEKFAKQNGIPLELCQTIRFISDCISKECHGLNINSMAYLPGVKIGNINCMRNQ